MKKPIYTPHINRHSIRKHWFEGWKPEVFLHPNSKNNNHSSLENYNGTFFQCDSIHRLYKSQHTVTLYDYFFLHTTKSVKPSKLSTFIWPFNQSVASYTFILIFLKLCVLFFFISYYINLTRNNDCYETWIELHG